MLDEAPCILLQEKKKTNIRVEVINENMNNADCTTCKYIYFFVVFNCF